MIDLAQFVFGVRLNLSSEGLCGWGARRAKVVGKSDFYRLERIDDYQVKMLGAKAQDAGRAVSKKVRPDEKAIVEVEDFSDDDDEENCHGRPLGPPGPEDEDDDEQPAPVAASSCSSAPRRADGEGVQAATAVMQAEAVAAVVPSDGGRRPKARRVDRYPRLMAPHASAYLKCSESPDGSRDFRAECEACTATLWRTYRPGCGGQERPFGMLWSWLADHSCNGDRASHIAFRASFEQRRQARARGTADAIPMNDWSTQEFLDAERAMSETLGDASGEPFKIP